MQAPANMPISKLVRKFPMVKHWYRETYVDEEVKLHLTSSENTNTHARTHAHTHIIPTLYRHIKQIPTNSAIHY